MAKDLSSRFFSISILIFVALLCFYLFLHSSFFNVEGISVTGVKKVTESEIMELSGLSPGINIFEINDHLCAKLIEIHPLVKSAKIVRHLPRQIEIQVVEREIWALIPYGDVIICIDREGVCIDKLNYFSFFNYPVITLENMPEHVNLGQPVQAEGIEMIRKLWEALSENSRMKISDFHYNDRNKEIIAYTEEGTEVRFGNLERLEEKAGFFSEILQIEKNLQKKGTEVLEYVDLRFEGQPVIKTKS